MTATNAVGAATRSYTITIAKAATTTTVTSSRNPSLVLTPVTFTATVAGAQGGTVTFTARGSTIGSPVPVVNGKATSRSVIPSLGATVVTATYSGTAAVNGSSGTLTQTVLLPAAFAGTPPNGTVGRAYRYAFIGTPGSTYPVVSGSLPAGLTLSPSGVVSGTPTARGSSSFTVRAANAVSRPDRAFTVRIG